MEQNNLDKIERQLEHSSYFNQTVLSQYAARINEIENFLYGTIDTLIEKGLVHKDEVQDHVLKVKELIQQKGEALHVGVALRIDATAAPADDFIPVNCEERLPICKAICCKLNFALSPEEVEGGQVKWDLGKPYFIRHEKGGYCSHLNGEKKCCTIYGSRPKVCRGYSCAKDERIWKDFDNMVLNQEWIDENIHTGEPKMLLTRMDNKSA